MSGLPDPVGEAVAKARGKIAEREAKRRDRKVADERWHRDEEPRLELRAKLSELRYHELRLLAAREALGTSPSRAAPVLGELNPDVLVQWSEDGGR